MDEFHPQRFLVLIQLKLRKAPNISYTHEVSEIEKTCHPILMVENEQGVVFQGVSHGFSIWFFHGSGLQLVIYGLAIALLVLIFVIPSPLIDPKGEGHHAEHIKQGRQMAPWERTLGFPRKKHLPMVGKHHIYVSLQEGNLM